MQAVLLLGVLTLLAATPPPAPPPTPASPARAPAAAAAVDPEWSTVNPVVVTAPSPRLWKLVRGGSTVWVLGEIEPLPRGLSWNSAPLARVIAGADRVLAPPEGYGGMFEALRALARSRLPGGATLDATLPPGLDARYRAVLARLGRNPNVPRHDKPAWAALFLELDFIGSRSVDVSEPFKTIGRIARDKHVKVQRVASYKAGGVLDELVGLPEDQGEAALADAVAGVDYGLDHVAAAGRAWAVGDLRTVRANLDPGETPLAVFLHTPSGQRIAARSVDDTTDALRKALATPGTTVAVLRLAALVQKGGALDRLRAEGVSVTEPPL
jgi:hypothetical protein